MRIKVPVGPSDTEKLRRRAERAKEAYGEKDPRVVPFLIYRAYKLIGVSINPVSRKGCQEALPLYEEALAILDESKPADDVERARACYRVGFVHYLTGSFQVAEERLLEALAVQEKKLPKANGELGATLTCLTLVYRAINQPQKAKEYYESALPAMYAKLESIGLAPASADELPDPLSLLGWWFNEDMALLKDIGSQFEADLPSSCFIATAVFQSRDHPAVVALRSFRDEKLVLSWWGRSFVYLYRVSSPPFARMLRRHHQLRSFMRCLLEYLVKTIQ